MWTCWGCLDFRFVCLWSLMNLNSSGSKCVWLVVSRFYALRVVPIANKAVHWLKLAVDPQQCFYNRTKLLRGGKNPRKSPQHPLKRPFMGFLSLSTRDVCSGCFPLAVQEFWKLLLHDQSLYHMTIEIENDRFGFCGLFPDASIKTTTTTFLSPKEATTARVQRQEKTQRTKKTLEQKSVEPKTRTETSDINT